MLTIPLPRLEREGTLEIQAEIPPDDPSWEGTEFRFSTPLVVSGQALLTTSGDVLVRVSLRGLMAQKCRRCLDPVVVPLDEELSLLFVPPGEDREEEEDSVRLLPHGKSELELGQAIREELIISHWPFALCKEDCLGLCPQCGLNLNQESCKCSVEEPDPRWDSLRALNEERD